ncbi:MAG: aldo/keto reductase [Alphaproteobacteria bacterium]|nr:aldo/keto reductase [Alphaproteobacteria bacterium]
MDYITLPSRKIPALGLGTWKLAGTAATEAVKTALEVGYRHIDTAQMYDNETEVGAGIKASGINRADIFLTTKVWMDRVGAGTLQKSAEESLKRLDTGYVDLLLIHWPNEEIPFREQIAALTEVKKSGKAKLIGVSNFTVRQLKTVVEELGADIVCNQVEYHPYLSQQPVLDYLRAHNMFLTAYCPLARGNISTDKTVTEIAMKYGKSAGQVTLRWLLQQPSVCAIPKAGSKKHILENIEIFDFTLTDEEMKKISALAKADGRIVSPAWAPQWDRAAA